jgi:hypothetical protein
MGVRMPNFGIIHFQNQAKPAHALGCANRSHPVRPDMPAAEPAVRDREWALALEPVQNLPAGLESPHASPPVIPAKAGMTGKKPIDQAFPKSLDSCFRSNDASWAGLEILNRLLQ